MLEHVKIFYTYLLTVPVFLAIDSLWLGFVAKSFYAKNLEELLSAKPNLVAAGIFYLMYIVGIVYFAVIPGVEKNSLRLAMINGAMFGGLAYATYDLTNLATLKNWPIVVSVVDIAWGVVLTTLVAMISFKIAKWL